mmetsp:Transcript_24926/g.83127  ORF Transcript_24926/g.83127 Transcript_24926/m.83127 type:complete len:571 (+) Transcript_24926:63-1775(+)
MASPSRWASLLTYVAVLLFLGLISYFLLVVPRAPLPLEAIAALASAVGGEGESHGDAWPASRIHVSASPGASLSAGDVATFVKRLSGLLVAEGVEVVVADGPPSSLVDLSACVDGHYGALEACLARQSDSDASPLGNDFALLMAPAAEGQKSALLLDADRGAVLRWSVAGDLWSLDSLAFATATRLKETWFRRASFENTTTLFEVAPAYVFSFFLVGDCQQRVAWDFRGGLLGPYLWRFLERLRLLVDVELDSQVVQCGSLGGSGSVVDAATLQADFLRQSGEWPSDTVTRDSRWLPPLVRFVAFKPTKPVRVVDDERRPQRSFAVQGWGVVSLVGAGGPAPEQGGCADSPCRGDADGESGVRRADVVSPCEAQQAASAWISSLRSWLTLPPDGPVAGSGDQGGALPLRAARPSLDGIASWELLLVSRAVHRRFLRRTVETLENFAELVDSLPDVRVRAEIGAMVHEAAELAKRSAALASQGALPEALAAARRALQLALSASHDDTVVAEMYFSWEFRYAVYLPIGLPILMPVLVALLRQLFRAKDLRQAIRKASQAKKVDCADNAQEVT